MSLTRQNQLHELITDRMGEYDGKKILEIVNILHQKADKNIYKGGLNSVTEEAGYSRAFRPVLAQFLKILKVVVRVGDVWYVVPKNVAEHLLQPTFVESAYNDIKREWTIFYEIKRLKKIIISLRSGFREILADVEKLTEKMYEVNILTDTVASKTKSALARTFDVNKKTYRR